MPTATGVVQTTRKDGKGFKMDDVWYSGYTPDELNGAQKGDSVTFEYTEKGQYKNIVKGTVQVTKGAPQSSGGGGGYSGGGDKQFRTVPELTRIDALRLAVDTLSKTAGSDDPKARVKAILKLAPVYVAFIEGSLGGGNAQAATAPPTDAAAAAEAAAKAEAEAKAKAEAEAKARAEAQAAQAQNSAAALDAFLDD